MPNTTVVVLGRFPPPLDGATVATERTAAILEGTFSVHRVSLSPPEQDVDVDVRFRGRRALHYLRTLPRVYAALRRSADAPVIWASISSELLGHMRDLAVAPAFRKRQAVFAVVHRGNFDELFSRSLTSRTGMRLVHRLAGVIFNTQALAHRCAEWIPPEKRYVIPNTVSGKLLCSQQEVEQKSASRDTRHLRLLYLSNMIPTKGYPELLEAAARLQQDSVSFEIRFAGRWMSDHQRRSFEHQVQEFGLQEVVTHLGPLNDANEIKALYLWADLFVLPTYYPAEAHPVTIIEALNAGTPVVSTYHASIPEMIDDGVDGMLVPPRDSIELAKAISSYSDGKRWQSASHAARRKFDETFSPRVVGNTWRELLEAVPHINQS